MDKLKLNRALVVAGARYKAGEVVEYSGDDTGYLVAQGFVSVADSAETVEPVATEPDDTPPVTDAKKPPARRTKAQIEADLAAAKAAEAALQADLSQASD